MEQAEAARPAWSGADVMGLDRLAAEALTAAAEARAALKPTGLPPDLPLDGLALVGAVLGTAAHAPAVPCEAAVRRVAAGPATVDSTRARTAQLQANMARFADMPERPEQRDWPDRLDALVHPCRSDGLKTADMQAERAAFGNCPAHCGRIRAVRRRHLGARTRCRGGAGSRTLTARSSPSLAIWRGLKFLPDRSRPWVSPPARPRACPGWASCGALPHSQAPG